MHFYWHCTRIPRDLNEGAILARNRNFRKRACPQNMLNTYCSKQAPENQHPACFNVFIHVCLETSYSFLCSALSAWKICCHTLVQAPWGSPSPPSLTKMRSLLRHVMKRLPSVLLSDSPALASPVHQKESRPGCQVRLPPGPGHEREPDSNEGPTFPQKALHPRAHPPQPPAPALWGSLAFPGPPRETNSSPSLQGSWVNSYFPLSQV